MTCSQDQHSVIKLVQHMSDEAPLMLAHILAIPGFKKCTSVQEYVHKTLMDVIGNWGTDTQLLYFAHLTNTCVFSYITVQSNRERFGPHYVNRNLASQCLWTFCLSVSQGRPLRTGWLHSEDSQLL